MKTSLLDVIDSVAWTCGFDAFRRADVLVEYPGIYGPKPFLEQT